MQSQFILDILFFWIFSSLIVPIPSTKTWHPAPPQSEPGQRMAIDNWEWKYSTNTATLLIEKVSRLKVRGYAICYHPLPSYSHKLTFRCGNHGSLARNIDKDEMIDRQLCKRSWRKVFLYSTVQYSTVQYCQDTRLDYSFYPTHHPSPSTVTPHPSHPSLSRRKIFEEEVSCRIAMRERTWPYQIRFPAAAQSSKAHLLESEVTLWTLATSL